MPRRLPHTVPTGITLLLAVMLGLWAAAGGSSAAEPPDAGALDRIRTTISELSRLGDRSPGTEGNRIAAELVRNAFANMGFEPPGAVRFSMPVRRHGISRMEIPGAGTIPLKPFLLNAISPGTIPPEGIAGPLVYAADGRPSRYNGLPVEGAVVVLDMDSGKNWTHAANFGAAAVVYLERGPVERSWFEEKRELTPIRIPRLWVAAEDFASVFDMPQPGTPSELAPRIRLVSEILWDDVEVENIYCRIPGTDERLSQEILIVEAFYDSSRFLPGLAPGADEGSGIAALLELARYLRRFPPARTVILMATGAHSQSLAGMRETLWSLQARSMDIKLAERRLKTQISRFRRVATSLTDAAVFSANPDPVFIEALADEVRSVVDEVSRRLMRLRLQEGTDKDVQRDLAERRRILRSLGWKTNYSDLPPEERSELAAIIPVARERHRLRLEDAIGQSARLETAVDFRRIVRKGEVAAVISLHLSSRGNGIGAFNQGWLHNLTAAINRAPAYAYFTDVLNQAAEAAESTSGTRRLYRETLRPSRIRPWQSHLPDHPQLAGELSALAGYHGISLVSVEDDRPFWGTPYDTPERVDFPGLEAQSRFVCRLIAALSAAPRLHDGRFPRNGFSTVAGRANFLRQGELFADQPAPGTVVMAFQGPSIYYARADQMGKFELRGVSDKRHVPDKVILEAYRFDEATGETLWAVDKNQTGKNAYRVKMQRSNMETNLVMFACRETTLFNLLEPRNFRYMTRIDIIDARIEAAPLRYWWSRIDTRESTLNTLFLEPGLRFKLTLSDTILRKKMILTNATDRRPEGVGYGVDDRPVLHHTELNTARDMWALIAPRIQSLEHNGIHDERQIRLQQEGTRALENAVTALNDRQYDRFLAESLRSWALASRVYDQVETTQKDVLFGVLFYIALFVPFAYCTERLLFAYRNIHRRIIAFTVILLALIAAVYAVHPAFELAYSPTVVILAFFIMGLSLIVTLIIFFRFEEEMVVLQRRATGKSGEEISRWMAFTAAFFLGVSNLRRRRLRTALTCTTLVILTFTIMSFTSVKSSRHQTRVRFQPEAPYQGQLLKSLNWQDLPRETYSLISAGMANSGTIAPRIWLETEERTWSPYVPLQRGERFFEARGLVGLAEEEIERTGLNRVLAGGRWFSNEDRHVAVISDRAAETLGIDIASPEPQEIRIWGIPHLVCGVFDSEKLQTHRDLDGEPLTPITFPNEAVTELTEVEFDALESGEDVRTFQSRYQHTAADVTLFMPYGDVLAAGGKLKGLVIFHPPSADLKSAAGNLVERFGLMLFSGESDGTFVYQSSDTIQYEGLPNVFIPMVISVLIVLNTMIGSVYERKNEIGIYTSVGLAPSHVGFLFVAEALAFAVLSVVMGYLFAQGAAHLFARTPLWAGITVNYSSLAGVGAMVLVIVVVLVSVLYPSRVAARIAIPDVNRSWQLPDPRANSMTFRLPFMVKPSELASVGGYLLHYFRSHQDVSHGVFSTGDISVKRQDGAVALSTPGSESSPNGCPLRIMSRIWLAPFDFGIMQRADIRFVPSGPADKGFLAIELRLVREAGEVNTWGRVNRQFVNALRKQLLIWRSLDAEALDAFGNEFKAADTEPEKVMNTP
ncbi:MAG: FtsX-like permease family protein [Desulfobacterales bacterium]